MASQCMTTTGVYLFLLAAFASQCVAADQPSATLVIEISGLQQATGIDITALLGAAFRARLACAAAA